LVVDEKNIDRTVEVAKNMGANTNLQDGLGKGIKNRFYRCRSSNNGNIKVWKDADAFQKNVLAKYVAGFYD
jgi:hypothetical protein